jgi:uncharacterized protein DUF5916/cellulose/xylan binding protein with CBM9 domain
LDGKVTEEMWSQITPAAEFIQQEPSEGAPATQRTEVRIGYDDDNLYIGIVCYDDDPEHIVVTQNRRDGNMIDTDSVQILLDTFHDRQNAFVFGTSPTGIEYDAQVSKSGQTDQGVVRVGGTQGGGGAQSAGAASVNLNWDAVWQVASQVTARGWESEMVIPFHTLRYQPGKDRTWGFQVMRNLRRRNEQSFWMPVSRAFDVTQVDVAGDLEGLDLRLHRDLRLLPYVLGGVQQDYTGAQKKTTEPIRQVGADVKYSVTPSLTLDATFNTDFAQVEVDEQQINLTRFDIFFPEKRPFFLENSGIFDFGAPRETELFFSRRIGIDESGNQIPIDAGLRLSGYVGRYEVGFLDMKTRTRDGIAPANNFTVARVKRNFRNRSNVGLIAVNRQSLNSVAAKRPWNRTFGIDGNWGLGKYANWNNFIARTESPGLGGNSNALFSSFRFDNRTSQINIAFREVGRNFNPEVGYLQRSGYWRPTIAYRHTLHPEGKYIRAIYPHFQINRWYTLGSNDLESALHHFDFGMGFQDGGTMTIAHNRSFERLDKPFEVYPGVKIATGRYNFGELATGYTSNQSATLFTNLGLSIGQFYDGTFRATTIGGGVRKGQNLTWSGNYTHNHIELPAGDFTTDLIGFRFNWSFTAKSYLQTFTQYNSRANQLSTNIRFALLSTSSNGLYVVYNTRWATQDFMDPHGQDRFTQGRALMIKYNYLFDF